MRQNLIQWLQQRQQKNVVVVVDVVVVAVLLVDVVVFHCHSQITNTKLHSVARSDINKSKSHIFVQPNFACKF